MGVIGKNGAGKSTLLKIISKVTKPTHGKVYLNGSISSLLEVGAGFNSVLTGKENLYMSGAILGMSRTQINLQYEDIVEFSGVRKFIDTPVSRYSSGMYLRLAFSVAAHLQSDILILDEVLSVGDYEFRRKATNRIKEIATGNRSIIYVAHQLDSLKRICTQGLLLNKGAVQTTGDMGHVIEAYTGDSVRTPAIFKFPLPVNVKDARGYVTQLSILNAKDVPCADPQLDEAWKIKADIVINQDLVDFRTTLRISSPLRVLINVTRSQAQNIRPGHYSVIFEAKGFHLGMGAYLLSLELSANMSTFEILQEDIIFHISGPSPENSTLFLEPEALVASPFVVDTVPSAKE